MSHLSLTHSDVPTLDVARLRCVTAVRLTVLLLWLLIILLSLDCHFTRSLAHHSHRQMSLCKCHRVPLSLFVDYRLVQRREDSMTVFLCYDMFHSFMHTCWSCCKSHMQTKWCLSHLSFFYLNIIVSNQCACWQLAQLVDLLFLSTAQCQNKLLHLLQSVHCVISSSFFSKLNLGFQCVLHVQWTWGTVDDCANLDTKVWSASLLNQETQTSVCID